MNVAQIKTPFIAIYLLIYVLGWIYFGYSDWPVVIAILGIVVSSIIAIFFRRLNVGRPTALLIASGAVIPRMYIDVTLSRYGLSWGDLAAPYLIYATLWSPWLYVHVARHFDQGVR